jgi:predicted esterase
MGVTSVFATDGVRYKDRLFEVSPAKTVMVADEVPTMDKSNFSILSTLMQQLKMEDNMMYFYESERMVKEPVVMDIYQPVNDKAKDRPVVLICHGGAFVASSKDDFNQKSVAYADSLAARGFVTASLEYRQGVVMTGNGFPFHIDSVDFARTLYRGAQDLHAAIRYLRLNAQAYGINPKKIYVLGNSAGAMLALENIYAQKKSDFPAYLNSKEQYILEDYGKVTVPLGALNEYGARDYNGVANGVVALWGGIHDIELVKNSKAPVFLAHGDSDYVMPYNVGHAMSDPERMIDGSVPEKYAPYVHLFQFDIQTPTIYGSYAIDSALTARGVPHEFYNPVEYGLKHEFYNSTRTAEDGSKIVFADSVQDKAFNFLYKLATDSYGKTEPVVALQKSAAPSEFGGVKPAAPAAAKVAKIAMGEKNLSFTVVEGENVAYGVFDLKGKKVMVGRASRGETVSLEAVAVGQYFLKVQGNGTRRISVTR